MRQSSQIREFCFTHIGSLWIGLHTKNAPQESEWQAYLEEVKKTTGPIRLLGFTDGGGPSGAHRRQFAEAIKGRTCSVAIITTSGMAYAIATAVQFLLPSTKVYRPRDFADALTYLNMSRAEISFAEQEATRLGQTMSAPLVAPSFLLAPTKG